jgi:hypothetical protein
LRIDQLQVNDYIVVAGCRVLRDIEIAFDHTLSGALNFGVLAVGESVIGVQLVIDVAFNDPGTLISLGLVSNPDGILSTANVNPNAVSTYDAQENIRVVAPDAFRLKVFPFTSTQGAGRVIAIVG